MVTAAHRDLLLWAGNVPADEEALRLGFGPFEHNMAFEASVSITEGKLYVSIRADGYGSQHKIIDPLGTVVSISNGKIIRTPGIPIRQLFLGRQAIKAFDYPGDITLVKPSDAAIKCAISHFPDAITVVSVTAGVRSQHRRFNEEESQNLVMKVVTRIGIRADEEGLFNGIKALHLGG